MNPVFRKISQALDAVREGKPYQLSWQQLMLDKQSGFGVTKRLIIVMPILNFSKLLPAEKSIDTIKKPSPGRRRANLPTSMSE